jgi:uncharacterized membrane protein YeaQ/YmgE (transglycosylase-associated protein family)
MPPYEVMMLWGGFGLIVGVLAKVLMPGKDPGGPAFTAGLGIAGAMLGSYLFHLATGVQLRLQDQLSFVGVLVATAGAFLLLAAYRVCFGRSRGQVLRYQPQRRRYYRRAG